MVTWEGNKRAPEWADQARDPTLIRANCVHLSKIKCLPKVLFFFIYRVRKVTLSHRVEYENKMVFIKCFPHNTQEAESVLKCQVSLYRVIVKSTS